MNDITATGIKWKSKDMQNRNTLHIVFRDLNKETNKYVYFHIQRRLVSAKDLVELFNSNEYKIIRKYKDLYYIQELDAHLEDTWYKISNGISKLRIKLDEL